MNGHDGAAHEVGIGDAILADRDQFAKDFGCAFGSVKIIRNSVKQLASREGCWTSVRPGLR